MGGYERSVSESERERGKLGDKLRALSLDLDKQPAAHLAGTYILLCLYYLQYIVFDV